MGGRFLTEDIVIEILLRLPSGSSIGRSRCVCRSWRNLLSDPNFLGRILTFKNPIDEEALRILITGISRGKSSSSSSSSSSSLSSYVFHYSSRSYATLSPVSGSSSVLSRICGERSSIVGCCDGIFCIATSTFSVSGDRLVPEILLWNPVTSETKILPPCTVQNQQILKFLDECTGFGFDPRTKDHKVFRVLRFVYQSRLNVFAEVYSLRNDSWKTLSCGSLDYYYIFGSNFFGKRINISQQRDTSRNEKCYWFVEGGRSFDLISSFDMTTEEFALVRVPRPPSREYWNTRSCFMSKGVFMATFEDLNRSSEIWGLLKYGVAESWTKLLTVRQPGEGFSECLEAWKDGIYIGTDGDGGTRPYRFFSFDPATGEIIHHHLEIEGTIPPSREIIQGRFFPLYSARFDAHTYLPTRVSLSLAAE